MLATIGVSDIEDLFKSIPDELRTKRPLNIEGGFSEQSLMCHIKKLADRNINTDAALSFLGGGIYRHFVPAAVKELAGRSEFVTPYTPYQPEISQGTLRAIFEYQTMMCHIFQMDVSNASNYDAATSVAEASLMARRIGKKRRVICIASSVHPEYRDVVHTVLGKQDADIHIISSDNGLINRSHLKEFLNDNLAAVIVQFPNFFGIAEDLSDISDAVHNAGGLFITATAEPLSLGMLTPPGAWGADIAVGEGLSFGMSTNFGGPTLGIFTAKEALLRNMPGRICGETKDTTGRMGYVLTMSTREQHIRRERATSNICSNQALCATTAAIYLSLLGKTGFQKLAELNFDKAEYAKKCLTQIKNVKLKFAHPTFNEFVIELNQPAKPFLEKLAKEKIFAGLDLGRWYQDMQNCLLVCTTEMNSKEDIDHLAEKMG